MRNLWSGQRRYVLACLVAVGGLLTAAASCEPTKTPAKEPPPKHGSLSIEPTQHDYGSSSSAHTFTVANNGPNTSGTIDTALSGPNPADFVVPNPGTNNTCKGKHLPANDTCIVEVAFNASGFPGDREADLVVNSDNPADGEAVATLTGTVP